MQPGFRVFFFGLIAEAIFWRRNQQNGEAFLNAFEKKTISKKST
jgi:hypothetical protein